MNEANQGFLQIDDNKINNTLRQIFDGMYDYVRVIDRNNNIIFVNKSMADAFGPILPGTKCYQLIGKDSSCDLCVSRKAVFDGFPHHKNEVIGDRTYSVMSSPVKNDKGEVFAVVEVLRDITQLISLQNQIMEQNCKLENDLNIARKLQCNLLPKMLPQKNFKYSIIYKPCETLGGDFLDIFKIDDNRVGVYIADVSGHGVSASMLTIFLRTSINKKCLSPSQALLEIFNEYKHFNLDHDLYITVFYAIIDLKEKTMVFSNAGHNTSPIIFNRNKYQTLLTPGIPICNWMEEPNYTDKKILLESRDRLFLYTDGLSEIKNPMGEQYGENRFLEILLDYDPEPSIALNRILDSVYQFCEIEDVSKVPDDIAMALIEII
ncbi:MAG TPA: SpoIIE family protein phosphatase [Clostridiaceae bacterium]|nr:SpoIIE family protein phosphatase [Clostridiaceae bacterium]